MIDFTKLDLVTSVDLLNVENEGMPVYHVIYCSQLYGTVFAIYGKFEGKKITKGKKAGFEIKKISMKLLNYKGVINIGFVYKPGFSTDSSGQNFLDFAVQGANDEAEREVAFKPALVVPEREHVRLILRRTLYPLPDFKKTKFTATAPTAGATGKLSELPPNFPLFDSEFYERDGVDFYARDPKRGMVNPKGGGLLRENWGGRCTESHVNLTF